MTQAQSKYTLIAKRYADALIEMVGEMTDAESSYEKISSDLNVVKEIFNHSKDLKDFLENPIISDDDKKSVLKKVFSSEIKPKMLNFLKVLVDKNRFEAFDEIVKEYNEILDEINNISRFRVTSAVNMTEEAKKRLKEKLESKLGVNVVLDFDINPEIIAGLVIKMGDNIIDTSLKQKLEDMKKAITK